ncbi:MAG: monovalent cation/H+ antiporter subunit D family protein [Coriobacteriia bacterium]|nr:monovalent cation/H+ antiporter subunit D family protein [Coriobacteriia bacterium]
MTVAALIAAVALPAATAAGSMAAGEGRARLRDAANLLGATLTAASVAALLSAAAAGDAARVSAPLVPQLGPGLELALRADPLGLTFAAVASGLWLVTTVYAIGYMEHGRDRGRFFGFFALCIASAIGVALAANLLTLLIAYEVLTLATWPLVAHSGTPEALRAGRVYLRYAIGAGGALLAGTVWLYAVAGAVPFVPGGSLAGVEGARGPLVAIFALLAAGFAVKAAVFPLHGWLPQAMVAPAPVSALLHAVAVVKAGAFAIVRLVLEVYGSARAAELGVTGPLAAAAAFTIVFASVRAMAQDDLKRRLAFSTVGQLSYIVLGVALPGAAAATAAVAHLAHHALMKITLFFTAGSLAETLHVYKVSELGGVGRRMPVTMTAFTLASLGIMGIPPGAGFATKYVLSAGGASSGAAWVVVLLATSGLLSAVYLLPIVGAAFFRPPAEDLPRRRGLESDWRLLVPILLTAALALAAGILAGAPFSPLSWAREAVAPAFGALP